MSGDSSPGIHKPFISKHFLIIGTVALASTLSFLLGFYVGRTRDQFVAPRLFAITGESEGTSPGDRGGNSRTEAPTELASAPGQKSMIQPARSSEPEQRDIATPDGREGDRDRGRVSRYFIQVGAFSNLTDAVRLKSNLAQKGYNTHIETDSSGSQELYKVRLGPYAMKDQADRTLADLKRAGKEKPFLIVID